MGTFILMAILGAAAICQAIRLEAKVTEGLGKVEGLMRKVQQAVVPPEAASSDAHGPPPLLTALLRIYLKLDEIKVAIEDRPPQASHAQASSGRGRRPTR